MKIEFVKETKLEGESFYFTQVDGKFIDKSLSYDHDRAKAMYDRVVANQGSATKIEILESIEKAD